MDGGGSEFESRHKETLFFTVVVELAVEAARAEADDNNDNASHYAIPAPDFA